LLRDDARGEGINRAPDAQKRILRLHRPATRCRAGDRHSGGCAATISARRDSHQGGSLIALPGVSFGLSTGEAWRIGRDLEQHAARRRPVDRTEAAAIDLLGRVQPLRRERADQFGLRCVVPQCTLSAGIGLCGICDKGEQLLAILLVFRALPQLRHKRAVRATQIMAHDGSNRNGAFRD